MLGRFLERIFFAMGQVALFTLGETENEDGKSSLPEKDNRSVALGFSFTGPRNSLLYDAGAEIGIHYAAGGAPYCFPQRGVSEVLLFCKTLKPFVGKYPPAKPGALRCEPLKAARRGR